MYNFKATDQAHDGAVITDINVSGDTIDHAQQRAMPSINKSIKRYVDETGRTPEVIIHGQEVPCEQSC